VTNSWKFKLGILGVFALGLLVGALGTGLFVRHRMMDFAGVRPEQAVARVMGRMERELGLTAEQRQAIEPIVAESAARMGALRARLTPEVEKLMAETVGRIKPLLTPEQQPRLDQFNARRMERWRQFSGPHGMAPPFGHPGSPPGGPPGAAPWGMRPGMPSGPPPALPGR
jgi:Spy/CpxP family protein refolding chaperone